MSNAVESVSSRGDEANSADGSPPLVAFAGGWDAHKDRHCLWIVTPPGYPHSRVFDEVALALQGAFEQLGGSAPIVRDPSAFAGRVPIIYGAHLLAPQVLQYLPADSVVINLEQVTNRGWMTPDYMAIMQSLPVLDYDLLNQRRLIARGIPHAELLEVGYHPCLTRIVPAPEQDIDILFYGSSAERRTKILDRLRGMGLNVVNLFNVYGEERDAVIARSKIVLNVHQYSSKVFEIVRVSFLLSNSVCVLTEGDAGDPALEPYLDCLAVEPYDGLVDRAKKLLDDPDERLRIGRNGLEHIARRPQVESLLALMQRNEGRRH